MAQKLWVNSETFNFHINSNVNSPAETNCVTEEESGNQIYVDGSK